jgi:hypothetical protein
MEKGGLRYQRLAGFVGGGGGGGGGSSSGWFCCFGGSSGSSALFFNFSHDLRWEAKKNKGHLQL